MKRIIALLLAMTIAGCATQPAERRDAPVSTAMAQASVAQVSHVSPAASVGEEALQQIQGWYNRADQDCGNPGRPAFLCSGVMLRATETNPAFLPWDPSPGSIANGGVSFSWLRQDANFANLVFGYLNGYIFYPLMDTPVGKDSNIGVLCTFPMDSDTYNRASLQGCGPNSVYPATSGPCETQGIVTAAQWVTHFNAQANKYQGQCGWSTREGERDTADHFYQGILARQQMPAQWWKVQNEMRLATWATGKGATLPIRAFFYAAGNADALAKAQNDQKRFQDAYGSMVPIIRLTLPASQGGKAVFAYADSDQGGGGGPGPDPGTIDFESVPLQGPSGTITGPGFQATANASQLSIVSATSPRKSVAGHVLKADRKSNGFWVDFQPTVPVASVSFGYWVPQGSATDQITIYCHYEGGGTSLDYVSLATPEGRHVCPVKAGGKVDIVSVSSDMPDKWIALDNFSTK